MGCAVNGDYVWVQLAYDDVAKTVTTATSLDGVTYTTFGAPMSTTQYLNQPGGFRIGVFGKRDGATANKNVELESFTLESDGCGSSGDTTAPSTTHTLAPTAPDGSGGFYKSDVRVTLAATDDGGGLGRVLLIAAALDKHELIEWHRLAVEVGLDALGRGARRVGARHGGRGRRHARRRGPARSRHVRGRPR